MSNKIYLFTTGASGGHVYPALAIAQQFKKEQCLFFIKKNKQSHEIIKQHHYKYHCLIANKNPFLFILEVLKLLKILKSIPSVCLISSGGSDTIAVVISAWLRHIPIILLEQNTIPGRSNRFLKYFAKHIFLSFKSSETYFKKSKTTLSGNPVFEPKTKNTNLLQEFQIKSNTCPTILVFGGSQGALFLNKTFISNYKTILNKGYNLILITGNQDIKQFENITYHNNKFLFILKYCHNMKSLYQQVDIIISRAGASSIAEFNHYQKKAILIPYPHAKDNHQLHNAIQASQSPSINYIKQNEFDLNTLFLKINQLKTPHKQDKFQTIPLIIKKINTLSQ